jgi:hypothetical protein
MLVTGYLLDVSMMFGPVPQLQGNEDHFSTALVIIVKDHRL